MARACAARFRTIDSSAICLACGLRSVTVFFRRSGRQRNLHAFVASAFAADLEHADGADLGDVLHMRAAARLQVDTRDSQQPHPPSAARRLYAHGLDQLGPGVELLFGNPDGLGFRAARDERIRLLLDLFGIEQAHVDIEIEARLVGRYVATRDW